MTKTHELIQMDDLSQVSFDEMARTFRRGPFVLFLGAGVNGTLGVLWKDLVGMLEGQAFAYVAGDTAVAQSLAAVAAALGVDLTARAEMAARVLGPSAYRLYLKKHLYSKLDYDAFVRYMKDGGRTMNKGEAAEKYCLLWLAASLAQCRNLAAVLTLNYDSFLEMAMQHIAVHDRKARRWPVCMTQERPTLAFFHQSYPQSECGAPVPIYHLHGYLPFPSPDLAADSRDIVLSQGEYLRSMRESLSTANTTSVHMLTCYPVLFLGLSMTDWNLLRHIEASQQAGRAFDHYWVGCHTQRDGFPKEVLRSYDRIRGHTWTTYGVKPIFAGSDYPTVQKLIADLLPRLDWGTC